METLNEHHDEQLLVPGLDAPVRIGVDRWGIAHIRASSTTDLFFAQGFNAARDRLWQIDLWRKRGLGLLAADFGPGFLAQDRASRLFLYRGDMEAEWRAYGPDARSTCEAFVSGINAYIDLVERDPERVPPEFVLLGTRPLKWRPEDVVRVRTHGWMRNALSEVVRANVFALGTTADDLWRMNLEPRVTPHVADRLDLASLPLAVMDVYKLATAPVIFTPERLEATLEQAWQWTKVSPQGEVIRGAHPRGSNNWAVAGARTTTGRPILASDPHRAHAVPSLRYLVHLTSPGLDVIGAGEPSFPGVVIGHNGEAAFGLTLFLGPDQEDVYVYETSSRHPNAYKYRHEWEPMRLVEETVVVKGEASERVTLKFTRHGPIVHEDHESQAVAVRSVWSEPGTTPYGASLMAMRARTLVEFRRAMTFWAAPPVNQVYADRDGDIAWIAAGLSPIRRNWDGLLPVPGDGRYEWDGFLQPSALPSLINPPVGFVASANALNLPDDWDRDRHPIGYEWDDPSRADRIREVLTRDDRHSVAASRALQTDVMSVPARRLMTLFDTITPGGEHASQAIAILRDWDCRMEATSGGAALFEVWWTHHLKPAVLDRVVSTASVRALLMPGDIESLLQSLERPGPPFGASNTVERDELLATTIGQAFGHCVNLMGPDVASWSWGHLHQSVFEHGLSCRADRSSSLRLDVGPLPIGGSDSTVMKAAYRPADFRVTMGASVRIVVDVGDWDRSVWINAPGQSGDPRSPYYADLAPLWSAGEYVPMLYTTAAVDEATVMRLVLTPPPHS